MFFIRGINYKATFVAFLLFVMIGIMNTSQACDSLCLYTQRAENFLKEKRYHEALENFNKAVEFDPQNIYLLNQLAEIQFVKRSHFQSKELCEKVLSIDPFNEKALFLSSQILLNANKYDESLSRLEKIKTSNDSINDMISLNKSMCLYGKKLYPLAIEQLRRIKAPNYNFNILNLFAKNYYELQNYKEASRYYIMLCNKDSNNYCRYSVAANSLYMAKKYDSAIQFYNISKKKGHPISEEFYTNVANCFYEKRDFENAILFFAKAKEYSPYNADLMYMIANSNMNLNRFESAREMIDEYLKTYPDDAEMVYMKGMSYYKENKTNKAEEYFGKAFTMKPELQKLRQTRLKL